MKKLINDPQDVMRDSLAGFAAAHSDILKVSFDPVYVVRADAPARCRGPSAGRCLEPSCGWWIPRQAPTRAPALESCGHAGRR